MKFDKIDIRVEKLGIVELFSYDGYILGFRDWGYSNAIFLFPIVINNENTNMIDLYFHFIETACSYNGYDYSSYYGAHVENHKGLHLNLSEVEVCDLIQSAPNRDVYIEPKNCFDFELIISSLMAEVVSADKDFVHSFSKNDKDKSVTLFLRLDDNNHVKAKIDRFKQCTLTFNSTTKKMDDVVNIFEHFLEMFDKNLNTK